MFVVLFSYIYVFLFFLRARHVHNKTAPCGMIKVFLFFCFKKN